MADLLKDLENFTSNLEEVKPKKEVVGTGYVKKKDTASERFLERVSEMGYDLTELEGALKTWGNQLVLSCAGSGKTTFTVMKILYGTRTGKLTQKVEVNGNTVRTMARIWVSTFLNSGARELEYEVAKWNKKMGYVDTSKSIKFSTIHAEFKSVLNACGISTSFIDAKANTTALRNIVKRFGVRANGKFLNSEQLSDLEGALTYTRNRLDGKRYIHQVYTDLGLTSIEIDAILNDWYKARKAAGKMDFEDLQDILYNKLFVEEDQNIIDCVSDRYDFLFIDEFQDTSQKQYAILKVYMQYAKQTVVVGDDDQTIYSWRGSDHKIITETFINDFSPKISKLSTNYRCPANIVNAIVPSIERNTERLEKSIKASKEGGEVRLGVFPSYNAMVKKLNELVYQDISDRMNVAIICRENSDGLLPAMMLDRDGRFSFSISGEGMSLNSYMVQQAKNVVRLVSEKATKGVASALKQLTYSTWEVDSLMSALKNSGESIWNVPMDEVSYSCPSLSGILSEWRNVYRGVTEGKMSEMDLLEYLLSYYHNFIYDKENTYNMRMRSILSSFVALVRSDGFESASEFLYELNEMNLRLQSRVKPNNVDIRIVTVHEFKGKEVDSGYLWNDSVDVFPHKKAETQEELEEERRNHYIGCTRPKKRLTLMTVQGKEGMFISEMDLSNAIRVDSVSGIKGSLKGKEDSEEARNRRRLLGESVNVDYEE